MFDAVVNGERFAFKDPNFDPDAKFPVLMEALRRYDAAYDLVWDRRKNRWAVITWMSADNWRGWNAPKIIRFVEDENGVRQEPGMWLIEWLGDTDWRKTSKSPEEHLAAMNERSREGLAAAEAEAHQAWAEHHEPWKDYLESNPTTNSDGAEKLLRAGFVSGDHLKRTQAAVDESHKNSYGVN